MTEYSPQSFDIDDLDIDIDFKVNNMNVIDRQDELKERMVQVVSKFASALTARQINVSLGDRNTFNDTPKGTIAKSDAESITFNPSNIGDLNDPDVAMQVRGTSLHEIGRILLTPRSGSGIVKWVRGNQYDKAFNALENQRTELFLSAKYSNVKHWFTASVIKYILDNPTELGMLFPLIDGRTYLPLEIRQAIRQAFVLPDSADELSDIISKYTVLNLADSAHIPLAKSLIKRYHDIINDAFKDSSKDRYQQEHSGWDEMPKMNEDGNGSIIKSSERSKPMNKAGQDRIIEKILKERAKEFADSGGTDEGEDYDNPEPGEQPGDKPGTNSGEGYGDKSDDGKGDGNSPVDGNNDNVDGNNAGGKPKPGTVNDISSIAKKHFNNIKNVLRDDVNDMIANFNGDTTLQSNHQPTPERSVRERQMPVPSEVVAQVKSFVNQLELIRSEHDPGWERKVSSGKLNVYRYSIGTAPDEVFDRWDEGREDVVDIETVILLDNSGSMGWTIESAHDSMWAIKRAMDKIGASTTVVTFADDARLLYSANQRAKVTKSYVGTAGGTEPKQALDYAKYIFANSERAIKILIVITDGVWYNSKEQDQTIHRLRKAGVITALGYVDERQRYSDEVRERYGWSNDEPLSIDGHNAEIVVPLSDGNGLLALAKALVKVGIKRNLDKEG
jgi:hypothetical protein